MRTTPEHTPLHGRRVHPPVTRGTGLWQAGEINGRPATDDELAARDSAYARQLEADSALVRVATRPPAIVEAVWALAPLPWEKKP